MVTKEECLRIIRELMRKYAERYGLKPVEKPYITPTRVDLETRELIYSPELLCQWFVEYLSKEDIDLETFVNAITLHESKHIELRDYVEKKCPFAKAFNPIVRSWVEDAYINERLPETKKRVFKAQEKYATTAVRSRYLRDVLQLHMYLDKLLNDTIAGRSKEALSIYLSILSAMTDDDIEKFLLKDTIHEFVRKQVNLALEKSKVDVCEGYKEFDKLCKMLNLPCY